MRKRDELADPRSCMNRARDDEQTFVLLARDHAAPAAVRAWIEERVRLGKNARTDPQIAEAGEWAAGVLAEQGRPAERQARGAGSEPFWAVVELMGHVRLAGRVSEEERFGTKLGRVDVPLPGGAWLTRYFGGQSVYSMTPCDEATARAVAANCRPEPVHAYELPRLGHARDDDDYGDGDNDPEDGPGF